MLRCLVGEWASTKEAQLGCHTIRSHGVKLLWRHLYDWLVLAFLLVLIFILDSIHPFHRFIGKEMMSNIKYPHQSNTVPSWSVPVISIMLPIMVILPIYYFRKDVYDLHHAVLGVLYSVLITGVVTAAIKDAVGRPRPDFFWRCFPDGSESYDPVTGNVICHGEERLIDVGHRSFPSGHTSWSFAGLGFLALYLSGKIRVFDQKGHVAKLCIVLLPLFAACLVGISRVDDYRHHWQDVFAGAILGLVVATLCYLQFFPAPYDNNGWRTHASFRALAEVDASADPTNNVHLQGELPSSLHTSSPRYIRTEDILESEELHALI